jgi:hypothetical protein
MNRTLLVLALALLCSAGCQSMGPKCGQSCGGPACQPCCESPHVATMKYAPRPDGCCQDCGQGCGQACGRGGNLEANCSGHDCCMFNRYCGSECGPGYPCGQYDCSPCNSPNWGCTGHGHPFGYKTARECYCYNDQCQQQECVCQHCGHHYCCCCGPASPGCACCPLCGCGPSGDHNYNFTPGPPIAQTAYPYYTLRGPRDFLMSNPPSIGPY